MQVLHVRRKDMKVYKKGGPAPRGVLSRRQDGGMGCTQVDDDT